jgi:anti-sigma B factor antagonist
MNVNIEERDGTVIVQPIGDVDLANSTELRSHLKDALQRSSTGIVIDLANVNYMDSSGVATLVECLQTTRNSGMSLRLCQLTERVLSVFQIARLDGVFEIVNTMEDAMTDS